MAHDRVIGAGGRLPWHLPEDLRRFKQTTMGHPLIMGRKTFAAIGKPLPGRTSIVVTRQPGFVAPPGVQVAASPEEALRQAAALDPRVFVIGGGEVYAALLPGATEILATLVDHAFAGDTRFPALGPEWHLASREDGVSAAPSGGAGPLRFRFARLVRGPGGDGCDLCVARAPATPGGRGEDFQAVLRGLVRADGRRQAVGSRA